MWHILEFAPWQRACYVRNGHRVPPSAIVASRLYQAFKLPPGFGGIRMDERKHDLDAAVNLARAFRGVIAEEREIAFLRDAGGRMVLDDQAFKLLRICWEGERDGRGREADARGLRAMLGVGDVEEIVLVDSFLAGVEAVNSEELRAREARWAEEEGEPSDG